jgi:multidrug resistance protein MdtO
MATLDSPASRDWPFLAFLREELAPKPGRLAAVARITTCCVIVVFTAMLYKIPEPAYSAFIVFFLGRGNKGVAFLSSVVGGMAATLAVFLSVILYIIDAGEPALRLPLMAASTFLGMYLLRIMTMGTVFFLASFVLVISQSLIEVIPNLEALTRFVLWLWIVAMLPDAVTLFVNMLTGPSPAPLARQTALRLLATLADALRRGDTPGLASARTEALELIDLRQHANLLDRGLRPYAALDTSLIEAVEELITLATLLSPDAALDVRENLAAVCDACREAFLRGVEPPRSTPFRLMESSLASLTPDDRPVVVAMNRAFDRLAAGLAERTEPPPKNAPRPVRSMFVPDAFTNRDHVHFALKTTLAAMASYIIYTGMDWPGIRTSLITCFFVALGSLGETIHKLALRVSGAAIGGLIGGLCVVFVLPRMEDIGDLILLTAGVSALCAWVATSSERLAYAGMQMALAFYLGVLQGYGPSDDLTTLRDRMVGLLLGNVLMSVVFSVFWPVSAVTQGRRALADAMRATAVLLLHHVPHYGPGQRLAVARAIAKARHLMSFAIFETNMLPVYSTQSPIGPAFLDDLDQLAGAIYVVAEQDADGPASEILRAQDAVVAAWFSTSAKTMTQRRPLPPPPHAQELGAALGTLPTESPIGLRSAIEARRLLLSKIEQAGTYALP